MKKYLRRGVALLLTVAMLFALPTVSASALSYPLIVNDVIESSITIPQGEIGVLVFSTIPAYDNEGYTITVYDANGRKCASASQTYRNSSYGRTITIRVNTAELDLAVGEYTVEYYMSFYTLYSWHDAPNKYKCYFSVIENKCNGNHVMEQTHLYEASTCGEEGWAKFECKNCDHIDNQDLPLSGQHTYDNACDDKCNVCNEKREVPHAYTWVVDREATCGSSGTKHEVCTLCQETRNSYTTIDATGKHRYADSTDTTCEVCYHRRSKTTILGDVDGSGTIDSTDARIVLQYAVKRLDSNSLAANGWTMADVDGSGKVDSTDARLILQYAVKKISKFPAA